MSSRILLLPLLFGPLFAGEFTASKEPFRIEHQFEATVLPVEPMVFAIEPEEWTSFVVETLVDHGTVVKKGDVVIGFKKEAYDQKLEDLKRAVILKELAVGQQKVDVAKLAAETELQLGTLKQAADRAADDLEYFEKVGRPAEKIDVEQGLEISRYRLASAEEELKQLKQMYEEDDLTEETEEIILKRQVFQVANAKIDLAGAEREAKRKLETLLPRTLEQYQQAAKQAEIAHAQGAKNLPSALKAAEIELVGAETELNRMKVKLERLTKQADWFEWKAPADGLVFHGGLDGGAWTYGDLGKSLMIGGSVPPRKTLVSLVPNDAKKKLAASVDATIAADLAEGDKLLATSKDGQPVNLTASVADKDGVPGPNGKFEVTFNTQWPEAGAPQTAAKLSCRRVAYENPEAVVIPPSALTATPDGTWVVEVKLADGKTERRPVTPGRATDDLVEILDGLEADQVVITKS